MHHSRLSTLMIDCHEDEFEAALAFWSEALGLTPTRRPTGKQRYVTLGEIPGPLTIRLQKVASDPGLHLDIETDDVRAEADRLERAGARRKYRIKRWVVMQAPSGPAFCVIRPESPDFPTHANRWQNDETGT